MKTKNIKVAYSTRYNHKRTCTVPKIQMEGKWLEELGFSVGSTIAVEYEKNSIRIRPLTEEELLLKHQQDLELELKKAEQNLHETHLTLSKVAEASACYAARHK